VVRRLPGSAARWWTALVVIALVAQMAAAMLGSAAGDAPTLDEPHEVATGLAYIRFHDLRWGDHPPLSTLIASIPLRFARVDLSSDAPEVQAMNDPTRQADHLEGTLGARVLWGDGNSGRHLIWLARLAMIGLSILFALATYGFARDLFGGRAAIIALAVATLSPDLIAHGRFVKHDVSVAGFALVCAWCCWRAKYRRPGWFWGAALALGATLASKYTALFLAVPLTALAAWTAVPSVGTRFRKIGVAASRTALFAGIAVATVWALYAVVDPHLRYQRANPTAERAHGTMAAVASRLPFPAPYRQGLRYQIALDQDQVRLAFLFGDAYKGGRPVFYPAVLAIKTPAGILALWGAALATILASRRRRELAAFLLAPPAVLLAAAVASDTNIGARELLSVTLFMAVAAAAAADAMRRRIVAAFVVLALVATTVSVWRVYPSYLAYANEVFGGPQRTYRLLASSDVDWGQDLFRLATALRRLPDRRVYLLYHGNVPLEAAGLSGPRFVDLLHSSIPPEGVHGVVAISATKLQFWRELYPALPSLNLPDEPFAQVGHSILLFRVP
jgi:4-amino-4-deoxy-L-arabinose transferase-like glycosyltransferase